MDSFSFADCLAPLSVSEFLGGYFQKDFLHIPGTPNKFARLFSWEVLNRYLEQHRSEPPYIMMRKQEKDIPTESYMESRTSDWGGTLSQLNARALTELLRDGATLSLHQMELIHRPLTLFVAELRRLFKGYCDLILFAAFAGTQAIYRHEDGDDNLILQIAGRKHWKLFGVTDRFPIRKPVWWSAKDTVGAPVWERVLEPGDVLYLPRGWWHEVTPVNEPSLHLTIGLPVHSGIDLVHWALSRLAAEEDFRQNLPYLDASARPEHVARLVAAFARVIQPGIIDEYFRDQESGQQPALPNPSLPWSAMTNDALPRGDEGRLRFVGTGWTPLRQDERDNVFQFRAVNREWSAEYQAQSFLRPLLEGEVLPLARAQELADGKLSTLDVQRIIARLVREGLLIVQT
jgi:ribosomal protein L16 Arg81 hydroxylase